MCFNQYLHWRREVPFPVGKRNRVTQCWMLFKRRLLVCLGGFVLSVMSCAVRSLKSKSSTKLGRVGLQNLQTETAHLLRTWLGDCIQYTFSPQYTIYIYSCVVYFFSYRLSSGLCPKLWLRGQVVVTSLKVRSGFWSWLTRTGPKFEKTKANKSRLFTWPISTWKYAQLH